ncbi:hypothetical protein RB195_001781 [Necator americanus]|uniref:Uncharacterized protein n=1 Tax=Necator americanus TaxID=51031 RepID=A0ABR1DFW5_NECAM
MMMSYVHSLVALLVIIRFSSQEVMEDSSFSRFRRNFFMSSGPSRARVMAMERLVNNMFPRKTRDAPDSVGGVPSFESPAENVLESNQPCICPVFSPCIGKCQRSFRY